MKNTNLKIVKLLIAINLLLIFALGTSGQTASFPNEVEGYKFYGAGKLRNIKILFSNEADVIKIFSKKYGKYNDYDDNWTVAFDFLRQGEYISEGTGRTEKRFYLPKKYVGKLSEIHFLPKKHISFEEIKFSKSFREGMAGQSGDELHPEDAVSLKTFADDSGLEYVVCATASVSGKYRKGDVFSIDYTIDRNEIFGLNAYYEKRNKKQKSNN